MPKKRGGATQIGDHALALTKAGLNAVPFVGGPVASLIDSYVPTAMERSTRQGLEMLGQQVASMGERLDVGAVNKDDFAELFNSCRLIWARSTREEKISAAASILASLFLPANDRAKATYEELAHFIRCVDGLSIGAIAVLKGIKAFVDQVKVGTSKSVPASLVTQRFSHWDASLVMGMVAELRALHLVRVQEPPIRVGDNELIELTPLGARFVEQHLVPRG